MRPDLQDDVQIAGRSGVRSGLSFARYAQACSGIDARRNPEFNNPFAFHTSLPATLRTAFANNLPGTLASRACTTNAKKSLLIRDLPAATAGLASHDTRTL